MLAMVPSSFRSPGIYTTQTVAVYATDKQCSKKYPEPEQGQFNSYLGLNNK